MDLRASRLALAGAALLGLSSCGETFGEQALVGAGAGAAGALVLDTNPVTGAVLGATANVAYCDLYPDQC